MATAKKRKPSPKVLDPRQVDMVAMPVVQPPPVLTEKRAPCMPRKSTSASHNIVTFPIEVIDPQAHRKAIARRPRKCLHCSDTFDSDGPGHRICSPCKDLEVFTSSPSSFSVHASF